MSELLAFDLADRLTKSLRVAKVGKAEMAEYLGVTRNTVGNYVNGRTTPDLRTLRLWAMRCGVPLNWLQTGETPPPHDGGDGGRSRVRTGDLPGGNPVVWLQAAA